MMDAEDSISFFLSFVLMMIIMSADDEDSF